MKLVLGAALVAALPAMVLAAPARAQDATIHAVDTAFEVAGDPGSTSVTVPPGGVVAFDYDSGSQLHNVAFDTLQPASCVLTEGGMGGAGPPLPAAPSPARWAGTCTFAAAGTYAFHCQVHGSMTGAVHVGAAPAPTAPAPPSNVSASAGDGSATVSFTPGADNGATITGYTVTATPGGAQATGTGSPIVVTGLANGAAYTFRVTATNAAGTSAPSAASAPVTPSRGAVPVPGPGGSGGGPAGGSGPSGGSGGGTPANAFTIARVRARASGVVTLAATLPGPGRLVAVARDARRSRRFARRQLDVAAAGTVTVRLRPGAAGRRLLRRSGRPLRLVLIIRYTPAGGTTRTITRRGVRIPRG